MQSDNAQSSESCSRCTYYRRGICFLRRIAVDDGLDDQRGCEHFKSPTTMRYDCEQDD